MSTHTSEPRQLGEFGEELRRMFGLPETTEWVEPKERTPEQAREEIRKQRMEQFRELCPVEFAKKVDRAKIPNLAAWDEADAWDGTFPGLWLWSHATGRAKSRMLWRHFGRLHVEHGRVIVRATGQQLVEDYFRFHMAGNPREWYRRLMQHDVIMIDDVDKADLSVERNVRAIRELFDAIYEANKPVLITANEDQAEIERRIGLSGGRRIRHVCREVNFA